MRDIAPQLKTASGGSLEESHPEKGNNAGNGPEQAESKEKRTGKHQHPAYGVRKDVYDARKQAFYYDVLCGTVPTPLLYCPKNLDLKTELIRNGHPNLIKHLWKLYYVITLLYLHRWNKSAESEECRPLNARLLRQTLGIHTHDIIAFLKTQYIIETDNHYVVGKHSRGYRLCEQFRSAPFRRVSVTELPRLPQAATVCCRHRIETDGSIQQQHLLATLKQITLADSSYNSTERPSNGNQMALDYYLQSAEWIRLNQWFFTYDPKTGRVFNNVTSLPRALRRHLRLKGESLVELDVVNCQPFLLLDLYSDEPERAKFSEIVCAGKFYEYLDNQLPIPFGATRRPELKRAVYSQILFDKTRPTPTKLYLAFHGLFPVLAEKIKAMKTPNHNALALHLQKIEATLIVSRVVRQIALSSKIPVLTVHDSILTLSAHRTTVRQMLADTFFEKFRCAPEIREKSLAS